MPSAILFCHLSFSPQTHSHLPRLVPTISTKKLHSFILTQLDDGGHLEICHVGFRHCHLGFNPLLSSLRFTQKHSHSTLTLTQTNSFWLTWWWQPSSILPSWILPSWIQAFLHNKNLTQSFSFNLMMGAILNSAILDSAILYMLDSDTAILDSDTLLSSLSIHSKTLSLHFDSDSNYFNLTQTHSFSPNLMMAAILNSAILNLAMLDSAILVFALKLTLAKIGSHHLHTKISLILSDSTWWLQPSWLLPFWIETLPSWIQTPCYLLSDSLKNTLTPPSLWLWLKLNQSD